MTPTSPPVAGPSPHQRLSLKARLLLRVLRHGFKPRTQKPINLHGARKLADQLDRWAGRKNANFTCTHVRAFGLAADWITVRPDRVTRVILYLHGGGFMFDMPVVHAQLAARLCHLLDAKALIPYYRCAPEFPLPAAHNDCYAAYKWLLAEGFDPARIIVVGDSAGGLLTLTTLQRARDEGIPLPMCGIMFSPATCLETVRRMTPEDIKDDPMFGVGMLHLLKNAVLDPITVSDAEVSPCAGSLHGLPPLLFQVGSTEALLSHAVKAHELALAAKTPSELQIWPHMPHVWQALSWLPEARRALADAREFVNRHDPLKRPPGPVLLPSPSPASLIPEGSPQVGAGETVLPMASAPINPTTTGNPNGEST